METREQFLENLERLTAAVAVLRDVAQGPASGETSLITIDSGTVKTVARVVDELEARYAIDTGVLQASIDERTTVADVDARIQNIVGAAPAALDTLQEIAAALGDDADFAGTMTTQLAGKAASVHTHASADVSSGTLDIARLPVAASGTSSSTQVPRADDSRLSDARTPTTHVHDELTIMPQNSQSANYTLVLSDAGKHIFHPSSDSSARTFTIPSNASVAYPIGTTMTIVNRGGTVTIAISSNTLVLAGTGATGSRTLAANGVATMLKIAATEWVVSGTGVS
ncbi:MAG: hypothetical protein FD149_1558 [Rhodospirillaceae bacterium]|nr:MAG: hypothetical protein FD149_1558 [Rhodospirillaceae bacterium]